MFKRHGRDAPNAPAKKPKLDVTKCRSSARQSVGEPASESLEPGNDDDFWGDDFAEDEIEQIDLVASQVCRQLSQETKDKTDFCVPSTSKAVFNLTNDHQKSSVTTFMKPMHTIKETENNIDDIKMTQGLDFETFERKLLCKKYHNSTFHPQNDVITSDNLQSAEIERLRAENQKLLNDFITKDGETAFLRNQLQQAQLRASNERIEKTHSLEEQAKRYRSEIESLCKEKGNLETELKLKTLELGKLLEKCVLLETKSIKLVEPCTATIQSPSTKSRKSMSGPISYPASTFAKTTKKESGLQTTICDRSTYQLNTLNTVLDFPLSEIPKLVCGIAPPEKPIVDMKVIEKTGKRNLPILQEEETFRIFENPDLVRPVATMVDNKKLSVEFVLPNLYEISGKTSLEINSENFVPTMNKLVVASQELMLNTVVALRKISQAMTNDDIRDMNDFYLSDAYNIKMESYVDKSELDALAWHERERGIEARRMIAILSHVTATSDYLSNYLAGKTQLLTDRDAAYGSYSRQMTRYNVWPKKGHDFEFLEMILEFATLVGYVRRSHQFSGLINAIAKLLSNVHKKTALCEKGVGYACQIFRELVFARPLPLCYVPLIRLLNTFVTSETFLQRLCGDVKATTMNVWKGALHFTPDACTLQILIVQMENSNADPVTVVNITHPLVSFVRVALQTNGISFPQSENQSSCNCSMKLLRFTLRMLSRCSEMVWNASDGGKSIKGIYSDSLSSEFWATVEKTQHSAIRAGIKLLCYLSTCDPDFIILCSVEDDFYSFMHNVNAFTALTLHESEKEALNLLKATFLFDKPLHSNSQPQTACQKPSLNIKLNQQERCSILPSEKECKTDENKRKYQQATSTFKALFKTKLDSNN